MRHDPVLLHQIGPHLLREAEVGDVLAVQVTDLATADLERQLAALLRVDLDAGPRGDLVDDGLAVRSLSRS